MLSDSEKIRLDIMKATLQHEVDQIAELPPFEASRLLDWAASISNDINIIFERTSHGESLEEAFVHCKIYKKYEEAIVSSEHKTSN